MTNLPMAKSDLELQLEEAQELRRSHCDRKNEASARNHDCVGVCTIDRAGVWLTCKLCGDINHPAEWPAAPAEARAQAVVEAVGLRWESLTEEARQQAILQINIPWVGR